MDNSEQQDFWTNIAGPKWVENQEAMDALMQPVLDGVLDRAGLQPGDTVLDIGCGTGASTLAAADIVGSEGQVLGADISTLLLDVARTRAAGRDTIRFVDADAATYAFEPASFDHLISRFGVMFFADSVAAFANMAQALKPGAQVSFASWGQIPNNPFFVDAAQAAREALGPIPRADPDEPGPFAFRDPERVLAILSDAGLQSPAVDVVDLHLTPPGTVQDFADRAIAIGPVEATLRHYDATPEQAKTVREAVVAQFAKYETAEGMRIPAEINFFTARAA